MRVLEKVAEFRRARAEVSGPLGLVPTMGYLHEGHLALVRRARCENDVVSVSIFVNPTQFGPSEDFKSYPRDMDRDLKLLEKERVALVFAPSPEEMYPPSFDTWVGVGALAQRLEGRSRPGHFKGVVTVVAKLFNIVRPDRAYFGQKDAQQIRVIRKMVADLDMNLEIVEVPTVREADGLALSSRNIYLNPQERQAAPALWRSLCLARDLWGKGQRDARIIREEMGALLAKEPLARIDYVSIADSDTLEELDPPSTSSGHCVRGPALVSMAVWIGKTRLIDNILLD